jgi:hypothetical protein
MKGKAPVAGSVLVAAFEALAGVAEHERAGRHQVAGGAAAHAIGAVLKRAGEYEGDGETLVALFEGAVAGSGGADDFGDAPAIGVVDGSAG